MNSPSPLAAGFPRFTEADWRAAVQRARKDNRGGEPVPLFPQRLDSTPIVARAPGQPWSVVERIGDGDAGRIKLANESGATGIELAFAGSTHPLGGSLAADATASLARAVPTGIVLRVDDGGSPAVAEGFAKAASDRGLDLVLVHDAIGAAAVHPGIRDARDLRALARMFPCVAAMADGRPWHAGGASDEQELGVVLATFVAYLRQMETSDRIGVTLVADADQFRTIAKFRAVRLLLGRLGEAAGGEISPRVHAETAWRSMSAKAPDTNILRATAAAFGAAAGGADSITVLPHDSLTGASPAGRRLARNTQLVLREEANVFRVADPGAGSGAIEAMTETLAEAAWRQFQAIEAEGGILASIEAGRLLREIAKSCDVRLAAVASGSMPMIGVQAAGDLGPSIDRDRLVFVRLAESAEASAT